MKKLLFLMVLMAGSVHAAVTREGAVSTFGTGNTASVMDPNGTYAYFIDQGFYGVFQGTFTQTTTMTRVALSNLTADVSFVATSTVTRITSDIHNVALIDATGQYGYFGFGVSSATITKLNLSTFLQVSSTSVPSTVGALSCGVLDPNSAFAYFGTNSSPAHILKINVNTLAVVSSITLPSPNAFLHSAVIDTQNHYAYFGSSTTPGNIARINLTNFSYVNTLALKAGENAALSGFLDHTAGYLWFGTGDSPGKLVQIQLGNFTETNNTLTLLTGENRLASVLYDPNQRAAYFGTETTPGKIVPVNPLGMKLIPNESLTLNAGENRLETAIIDKNDFGYFGAFSGSGDVIKVDLIGGAPSIVSVAPPEVDASVGQTATFSIAASGRNLTYQWMRDGTAISGATQTNYTVFNVTLADDGATFACNVTNSSGTVASGATTLTVNPDVHVYPDPWRANRHAGLPVTFNNLLPGSSLEIFTLAAQWVQSIPESGGMAKWDLKNSAGQNAASGYYFYYVKTPDDRHTLRGKFAIIR